MSVTRRTSRVAEAGLSAVEVVYRALFDEITQGERAPGSRLVEMEIAALHGVSRTPVRGALSRLEAEHLVAHSTSKGLVVAELSREEIDDIYAMRAVLEGFAARLAAYIALPYELQQLDALHEQIASRTRNGDLTDIPRLNYQFHREIHRTAKNATLHRFVNQIYAMLRRYRGSTIMQPGRAEQALDEHEALLDAIRRRAPDEAEQLARRHIENAQRVRLTLLNTFDDR